MIFYHSPQLAGAVVSIPDGAAGIKTTLARMVQMRDEAKVDPTMRARVSSLLLLQPEKDELAEIAALFRYVRDRVRYQSDVVDVETLTAPEQTIRLGAGDCDDKALLLAAMLEAAGHRAGFIATGYTRPGVFEHVYVIAELADGSYLPLDPSEPVPPGWDAGPPVTYHVAGLSC